MNCQCGNPAARDCSYGRCGGCCPGCERHPSEECCDICEYLLHECDCTTCNGYCCERKLPYDCEDRCSSCGCLCEDCFGDGYVCWVGDTLPTHVVMEWKQEETTTVVPGELAIVWQLARTICRICCERLRVFTLRCMLQWMLPHETLHASQDNSQPGGECGVCGYDFDEWESPRYTSRPGFCYWTTLASTSKNTITDTLRILFVLRQMPRTFHLVNDYEA